MHTPRLVVRLIVALLTFVLGISSTLLFNYLRPSPRVSQPGQFIIIKRELSATPPPAHAPCGGHDATMQHAFAWTPEAPTPLAPPPPPRPRTR